MNHTTASEGRSREPARDAERGIERLPAASRSIDAFPPAGAASCPMPLGALLALAPEPITVRLRFGCPAVDAPLGGRIDLMAANAGKAEQWLDQVGQVAFGGCRLERASSDLDAGFAHRYRVAPLPLELETDGAATPRAARLVANDLPQLDLPLVHDIPAWTFELDRALGVAAAAGRFELEIEVSRFRADARTLRALGRLKERLAARAGRMGGSDEKGDALASLIGVLTAEGEGVRVDVYASFEREPDNFTLDLLSLCLFGRRCAGEPVGDAIDLRGVWPNSTVMPGLVPTAAVAAKLSVPAPLASAPQLAGSLIVGRSSAGQRAMLTPEDRARHLFIVGATGTGKSSLMLNLLRQDFESGEGVILLDPHGDLADDAVALVPTPRLGDLIFADAADPDGVFRVNILAGQGGEPAVERNYVANSLIRLFTRVLYAGVPEAFGPVFESYFRNALMLLMEAGGEAPNLLDFDSIFLDDRAREQMLERCTDAKVIQFWTELVPAVTHDEISLRNMAPYITSKLAQFTGNPVLRRLLCHPGGGIDLRRAMDDGRIVILKMPKGLLGQTDTELLGALMATRIAQLGMGRAALPRHARRPVRVYIDEFQTCAGEGLADLLAEARKFGISLVLANQSLTQVDGRGRRPGTGDAALANAANLIAFRVGAPDAAKLGPWFAPEVPWAELCRLPDFHAMARTLDRGRPAPARLLKMAPPPAVRLSP
jgi:hypothetical protein